MIRAEDEGVVPGAPNCAAKLQAAIDKAVKTRDRLQLGPGHYKANLFIENVKGLDLSGASRDTTVIVAEDPKKPALCIHGLWFSHIHDIGFGCGAANADRAVFEIDRGTKPDSHGVQGNTFMNMAVNARGLGDGKQSRFAMSLLRNLNNAGQGDLELFLNCYFYGGRESCYHQQGYNALSNRFVGGNFQSYPRNGITAVNGSVHIEGTSFQANSGIQQLLTDGWDIWSAAGGVYETIWITACRTESLRFAKIGPGQSAFIVGCTQRQAVPRWYPETRYRVDQGISVEVPETATALPRLAIMKCKVEHRSGSSFDKEKFEELTFNVVDTYDGFVGMCDWETGDSFVRSDTLVDPGAQVHNDSSDGALKTYVMHPRERHCFVDATRGPVKILCSNPQAVPHGTELIIFRGDESEHQVEIWGPYFNSKFHHVFLNPHDSVRLKAMGGGTLPRRWWVVDKS